MHAPFRRIACQHEKCSPADDGVLIRPTRIASPTRRLSYQKHTNLAFSSLHSAPRSHGIPASFGCSKSRAVYSTGDRWPPTSQQPSDNTPSVPKNAYDATRERIRSNSSQQRNPIERSHLHPGDSHQVHEGQWPSRSHCRSVHQTDTGDTTPGH